MSAVVVHLDRTLFREAGGPRFARALGEAGLTGASRRLPGELASAIAALLADHGRMRRDLSNEVLDRMVPVDATTLHDA